MNKLNFEIPVRQPESNRHPSKLLIGLLIVIILGIGADILISLNPIDFKIPGHDSAVLNPEQLKKIALKLEKNGLNNSSALAWKDYLDIAKLEGRDAALIWYRIGKLYRDINDYEQALNAYYRSESIFSIDSIAPEIALQIQECLESMGKFSAMRHELADRVSLQTNEKTVSESDPVVAEIGTRKITASEIDRRLEDNLERQINMMAPYLPEDERNKQKESLLKQFSTPANRLIFLNQFIGEEILYRKAREDKLTEDPKITDLLTDQEKGLLASMVLEKEYDDQIKITLSDLETYYSANKDEFMKEDKEQVFDQVKNDVYKTLRSQKEQEVRQQLLSHLKDHYDVVIHQSAFAAPAPSDTGTEIQNQPTVNNK